MAAGRDAAEPESAGPVRHDSIPGPFHAYFDPLQRGPGAALGHGVEQGAVDVDGELVGTGSTTVKLKRGKTHVVEVKKEGYRTAKVTTDKAITGWFWGNLICGGIPGGAIDLISGSAYDVDPDNISVTLEPGSGGSIEIPTRQNFGELNVLTPEGEQLATVTVQWE